MQSYRVETTVSGQGAVVVENVPFSVGDHVEVIVREVQSSSTENSQYPLRNTPIEFSRPFDGVAESEWEIQQ